MKDHEIRELVNEVTRLAIKHKDCGSLRDVISRAINKSLRKNEANKGGRNENTG